jgi:PII-like signaling protein
MNPNKKVNRLRIYISSTDKFKHTPLYEVIVYAARRNGITGATVIKGMMGFGASSEISSTKLWEISEKLPVVVEIIDEAHKIESFYESIKPYFDKIGKGHIITLDETIVLMHRTGDKKQSEN